MRRVQVHGHLLINAKAQKIPLTNDIKYLSSPCIFYCRHESAKVETYIYLHSCMQSDASYGLYNARKGEDVPRALGDGICRSLRGLGKTLTC